MTRLGRIYQPDSRDWDSQKLHAAHAPVRLIDTIPASKVWTDAVVLDQGDFGTCVGNGWAGWGESEPITDSFTESDARRIYYEATVIDGSPDDPDKPGGGQQGSSVRSGAKAMQARGRLAAYAFAANLTEVREWLANHGPVVIGSDWTSDMFNPDKLGKVSVTGSVEGGHCYLCIGYDSIAGMFFFRNSWGTSWGVNGDFHMTATDLTKLLAGIESPGEACLAVETAAVPTDPDGIFAGVLRHWVGERHYGENKTVQTAAKIWLASKNLEG